MQPTRRLTYTQRHNIWDHLHRHVRQDSSLTFYDIIDSLLVTFPFASKNQLIRICNEYFREAGWCLPRTPRPTPSPSPSPSPSPALPSAPLPNLDPLLKSINDLTSAVLLLTEVLNKDHPHADSPSS